MLLVPTEVFTRYVAHLNTRGLAEDWRDAACYFSIEYPKVDRRMDDPVIQKANRQDPPFVF